MSPGNAADEAGDATRGTGVHCRAVTHQYGEHGDGPPVVALDDVTLDFEPGALHVIAGPSGSGKSTLLHLLALLSTPTSGDIVVGGVATGDLSEGERTARRLEMVGMIFQRFHLLDSLTARSNVALPLVERGVGRHTRRERAVAELERVGMGDRTRHRPDQLSGGEAQRVAIARALVTDPAVVVADEPTGELDTDTGERILDVLADIARERTVVVASHDLHVIEAADRVVRLVDGRVAEDA